MNSKSQVPDDDCTEEAPSWTDLTDGHKMPKTPQDAKDSTRCRRFNKMANIPMIPQDAKGFARFQRFHKVLATQVFDSVLFAKVGGVVGGKTTQIGSTSSCRGFASRYVEEHAAEFLHIINQRAQKYPRT